VETPATNQTYVHKETEDDGLEGTWITNGRDNITCTVKILYVVNTDP
jgi:hypothetical protein